MHISHCKQTFLAGAPDALAACLEKYENCTVSVAKEPHPSADVVHFHNFARSPWSGKSLIQFHTEPERVDLSFKGKRTVIAQYHATLPEYADCQIVRNAIDFEAPEFEYSAPPLTGPLIVGFTPSSNMRTRWGNKGIMETLEILERLRFRHWGRFEYRAIQGFSVSDSLAIRKSCHVLIDECMTGSFHRTGLEGLALGRLTLCGISESVTNVLLKASRAPSMPFQKVEITDLEAALEGLLKEDLREIATRGREGREWMENHWHPKTIAAEFMRIYQNL